MTNGRHYIKIEITPALELIMNIEAD